ncbi:unnamed protein product [Aureobasidium uvarum]|uniref:Major facilitator superfamily (MFS) profile domain-containing protein n=1 Tax=Aureobasidium uvarum TaxID=2773716 RepID=A0A9N8KVF2_9PEZI|nr:unnamed protein product [Aureobasidium uvarum]
MQSLRQYKQLRQAVQRQLSRDTDKAKALSAYTQQHGLDSREEAQIFGGESLEKAETPSRDEEANDDQEALDAIVEDEMEDSYPQTDNQNELNRIHTSRSHHATLARTKSENADLSRIPTHRTHYSERTALGYSMTGINARLRATNESENGHVFVVEWEGSHDPLKPQNWSTTKRMWATVVVSLVALAGTAASSIDAAVLPQYADYFHVSEVAGSLATAMYLIGFAVGSQFAGPFSETFGRNIIYIVTMCIYMLFLLGCALAPNFGGHIVLRFFAGLFGSTPLTVAGGTIADLWNPLEKTFSFPVYAFIGFSGPLFGPVIGSYIGPSGMSWRWCEWLMLILGGIITTIIIVGQPETYGPLLLSWKAHHLRVETGDDRYRSPLEVRRTSLWTRLKIALWRPFAMIWTEPIILLMSLYLTVLYIVLFTFFIGFEFVFTETYGISQGITNIIWVAVFIGFFPLFGTLPLIYSWTVKDIKKQEAAGVENPAPTPESRLYFAMLGGALAVPVSLFWMGWTDYANISIWSPIIASALFGYGVITIFISAYMYIIDSYAIYAASALSFVTFTRYLAAGGMTVVGVPWYRNMGVHYTLTILACISALMVPVPYVFYIYGARIRTKSAYAVHKA